MDIIYPIGKGELEGEITPERRIKWIKDLEDAPKLLREAVEGLDDEQLDTPYREGGWTIRQIVHHLTDSNINSYVRFKLAVTENQPTIKTWEQSDWAVLEDAVSMPVDVSLSLLDSLHQRWVVFLKSLTEEDMKKKFVHPEGGVLTVEENIWNYSWHSRHHTAQITASRERKSW
ncbi:MAG: YfiT family bacillithiol transferase [Candidatus Bathyarchaeota archaeon]|jgi:uncharacterized damage-inducible protein DinB